MFAVFTSDEEADGEFVVHVVAGRGRGLEAVRPVGEVGPGTPTTTPTTPTSFLQPSKLTKYCSVRVHLAGNLH